MSAQQAIENPDVARAFEAYAAAVREKLLRLRQLILEVANENPSIGKLDETLKWGQISYRPHKARVGTTVRIDQSKSSDQYAIYVPCTTTLVDSYRSIYGSALDFEGDRAIVLNLTDDLPEDAIKRCIEMALTYHLSKKIGSANP